MGGSHYGWVRSQPIDSRFEPETASTARMHRTRSTKRFIESEGSGSPLPFFILALDDDPNNVDVSEVVNHLVKTKGDPIGCLATVVKATQITGT